MKTTPTNADRAEWARAALEAFQQSHAADDDMGTCIKDLITDLLHLARRETDVDPVYLAASAAAMHDEERREDIEE